MEARDQSAFERMMDAYNQSRNAKRRAAVSFQSRVWLVLFPWMNHPFLRYITAFWIGLIDEGPRALMKPRWGGITFGWLNDGIKPTVWHTWRQLTHSHNDPYTGIYIDGAPASLEEAKAREIKYAAEPRHDHDQGIQPGCVACERWVGDHPSDFITYKEVDTHV